MFLGLLPISYIARSGRYLRASLPVDILCILVHPNASNMSSGHDFLIPSVRIAEPKAKVKLTDLSLLREQRTSVKFSPVNLCSSGQSHQDPDEFSGSIVSILFD